MIIQNWKDKKIHVSQFNSFNYDQDSLNTDQYPYAMICFLADDETMIAVGTDPLSPKDFMDKNRNSTFMIDFSVPPRTAFTMHGQKTVYYAKKIDTSAQKQNDNLELDFVFHSSDHLRYENGKHVSGPHGGAPRAIKVEANISGNEGYTVTIFNTDGGQTVVQMAPKQMRLQQTDSEKIILKGYGCDAFGASFADYGLTIYHNNGDIEKCVLHMYDRGVDIEYLQSDEQSIGSEGAQQNGYEEIRSFLNKFMTQPMSAKAALAQKTDELNNTGVSFYERDDIETAIAYYNKALEIFPINDDALKNLVVCYRETGNYRKMQEAQEKLDYLKKLGL